MKIELREPSGVKPYAGNPRQDGVAVDAVAESIGRFRVRQPIMVDAEGVSQHAVGGDGALELR
jgi:ParB-like chromosome segregation protein Spo0J